MGYVRHDAIVVTGWDDERMAGVREIAKEIGLTCSEIVASPVNGYLSFLIAPDGSKEGWAESTQGEKQRAGFIKWLRETDNNHYCAWVHINYGGDDSHRCSVEDFAGKQSEGSRCLKQ